MTDASVVGKDKTDVFCETIMPPALARYPRESFCLATKFPGYDPANWSKVEEIFETQLMKLNFTYFDFYLFHNVCEMNIEQKGEHDYIFGINKC